MRREWDEKKEKLNSVHKWNIFQIDTLEIYFIFLLPFFFFCFPSFRHYFAISSTLRMFTQMKCDVERNEIYHWMNVNERRAREKEKLFFFVRLFLLCFGNERRYAKKVKCGREKIRRKKGKIKKRKRLKSKLTDDTHSFFFLLCSFVSFFFFF